MNEDDLRPEDPMAELHYSIAGALKRCLCHLADEGDIRLLCYACGVDAAELGLPPEHTQVSEPELDLTSNQPF